MTQDSGRHGVLGASVSYVVQCQDVTVRWLISDIVHHCKLPFHHFDPRRPPTVGLGICSSRQNLTKPAICYLNSTDKNHLSPVTESYWHPEECKKSPFLRHTDPQSGTTDLYIYTLDAAPPIHIVSNHVATDTLTTQNVYKLSWLGWASLSSQSC